MDHRIVLLLIALACLSVMMVIAIVPVSLEHIRPSRDMSEHRLRLRGMDIVSRLVEKLIPHSADHWPPRLFWDVLYVLTWLGIGGVIVALIGSADPEHFGRGVFLAGAVVGGWWGVHCLLLWLARVLSNTHGRTASGTSVQYDKERMFDSDSETSTDASTPVGAVESNPSRPLASDPSAALRQIGRLLWLPAALLFVVTMNQAGETYRPLIAIDAWITDRQTPLLFTAGTTALLGFLVFLGAILNMLQSRGRPIPREEIEEMSARRRDPVRRGTWRLAVYRHLGMAAGVQADDQFNFTELKKAWRERAWRTSRLWRRRFVLMSAVILMSLGMCGVLLVLSPMGVKFLIAGMMMYVLLRMAWSLHRADSADVG